MSNSGETTPTNTTLVSYQDGLLGYFAGNVAMVEHFQQSWVDPIVYR